jgi:hypothetical protein
MQSRTLNDGFQPNFNFGHDNLLVFKPASEGKPFPPVEGYFLLLNGGNFLLLNGGDLTLL